MNIDERYFSINELVGRGIASKSTLHRWISSGKLKSCKFGRSRRIPEGELIKFIDPNQSESHQTTP